MVFKWVFIYGIMISGNFIFIFNILNNYVVLVFLNIFYNFIGEKFVYYL